MQNNRDSSVLRSLAIAFGDGLAFGVGMKLTRGSAQSAPAPSLEAPMAVDVAPLLDRLDAIETRIGKVERTPAPPPLDPKVLEAIVNALDARLREQAEQVEQRLTELEAKLAAELKSLQQQDHSVVTAVQSHIEELNGQFNDQLAAIRRRSDEERTAMQREIASLHREFAVEAAQAVDARTAELRAEIASRDNQIADLQARLEAGDEKLGNVVLAIAQACQTVLGRNGLPSKAEPERIAETSPESPLPAFAQPRQQTRYLPVPVVTSVALLSAAGFAMMHYL